jgi:hypothetical protein
MVNNKNDEFRAHMAWLNEKFPDKDFFNVSDLVKFMNKDARTIKKIFPMIEYVGISKISLARRITP